MTSNICKENTLLQIVLARAKNKYALQKQKTIKYISEGLHKK